MRMSDAMSQAGWEVTLLGRSSGKLVASEELHHYYGTSAAFAINLLRWPRLRGIGSLWFLKQTSEWLKNNAVGLDVVYGRHTPTLRYAARIGLPAMLEVHAPPASGLHRLAIKQMIRAPGFRRIVTISAALRDHYLTLFPELSPHELRIAHDGADDLGSESIATLDRSLAASGFSVGYLGHLYKGKGMEIIAAIAPRMLDIEFHVVGGNAADVRAWQCRVQSPNLHFHGFQTPASIGTWVRSFDMLVAPYQRRVQSAGGGGDISRWMSPLKIFEYMSAGKPIIASDLPVIREVLTDNVNALLVAPDDTEAWISAVRTLRTTPALASRLARTARNDFLLRHTWRARAEAVLA